MKIVHDWFWRRFRYRYKEDSFDESEVDAHVEDETMRRLYARYRDLSWSDIQELHSNAVQRERDRVRVEFHRYVLPIRKLLSLWYRILSRIQS